MYICIYVYVCVYIYIYIYIYICPRGALAAAAAGICRPWAAMLVTAVYHELSLLLRTISYW